MFDKINPFTLRFLLSRRAKVTLAMQAIDASTPFFRTRR
jgi:hypothetical protein